MADGSDKPNKSNKPVNGQVPKHLDEAFAQREYLTSYEHLEGKDDLRRLNDKLREYEDKQSRATKGSPDYNAAIENIGYIEADLFNLDKHYADRENQRLASTIATYTKTANVNQRTTTASSQQRFFKQAHSSPEIYRPTEMIEANIQSGIAQASSLGTELAGRARGIGAEELPDTLREKAAKIGSIEEEIAFNKRLLKVQNKEGLSTEKLFGSASDAISKTNKYFGEQEITNKVSSRNVRSIEEEEKALGSIKSNTIQLQEDYDSALESGSDKVLIFAEKLAKATEALDKQQKVVDEMNRQGVSGPGGGGMGWGDVGMVAALAGRATAFTARSARQIGVDNDIVEMGMKTRFAAMGNRIYNRAEEGIVGGNMDALLELTGGSLDFASKEANFNKTFTNVAEGVAQVGDVAEGVGNTVQAGIRGGKAGLGIGSGVTGTTAAVSQGAIELSKAAVAGDRLRRGIIGGDKSIASYETSLGLSQQMRAMDSRMMQAVFDQGQSSYNSVQGLGGAGGLQGALMDTGTLGRMAGVGLTPERAAQLTAGLRAAGSMTTNEAMRTVQGAGAARQRGILGADEYVSMSAQLMGAGGGAGDMESIMASAVAAGMDNSKSIGELVSGTLMLSSSLASSGVGATGANAALLGAGSQALIAAGVDPNLAANASMNSISNFNAAQSGQGFTLGNILERAGTRRMGERFNNASTFQLNRMGEMSTTDHKVLLDAAKNPENKEMADAANQLLRAKGLTEVLNADGKGVQLGDVRELQKLSFTGALVDKGVLGTKGANIGAIYDKAMSGEKLTDKEQAIFAEYGGARGEVIMSAMRGDDPGRMDPNSKKVLAGAGAEKTAADFKVKELTDAEKGGPGNVGEIFTKLETTLAGLQENIGPEMMKDKVVEAAKSFEPPVLDFKDGAKEFKEAVKMFVKHQNKLLQAVGETGPKKPFEPLKAQDDNHKSKAGMGGKYYGP